MTILELEILFHCYYSPSDTPLMDSPAGRECVQHLLDEGLICPSHSEKYRFATTDRAAAYIEAIRSIPLPLKVERWEIPAHGENR